MNKITKKVLLVFCLSAAMLFGAEVLDSNVYAAEVGQKLLQPEEGWQRFDDLNEFLCYSPDWARGKLSSAWYDETGSWSDKAKSVLTFRFKGTKFRIIGATNNDTLNNGSKSVRVTVDGEKAETYDCHKKLAYQVLLYEKDGLEDKDHVVTIQSDTDNCVWMDAIDIPNDAVLLNANPIKASSLSLNKTEMTINVEETQNLTVSVLPVDTTDKSLTWTSSNSTICTVDKDGKLKGVEIGNAVITAVTNDGSGRSASCNVKVIDTRRGILTINMNNTKQYTYDLDMPEIRAFDRWYINRTNGDGSLFYKLTLENGDVHTVNYNNISDYIVHKYKK